MSQYGTTADYCRGYDDAADQYGLALALLRELACRVVDNWERGDLASAVRALNAAIDKIPEDGHIYCLDETTYPPGYSREESEDDESDI